MEKAYFGAGCFWGVEAAFKQIEGVTDTAVGYAGGHVDKPSYSDVCSGATGHAETVEVEYDPNIVSYDDLLELFFRIHDPTTPNRQGADIGTQYRSVIFFRTKEEKETAEKMIKKLEENDDFNRQIVTSVDPFKNFYRAEEYHQDYYSKKGIQAHKI